MRFNRNDWLLLVATSALAALAMAGVTWASGAIVNAVARPTSPDLLPALAMANALVAVLADALATWVVLRRCVSGLRLSMWLLMVALGLALAAAARLPSWVLAMPMQPGDLLSLGGDPVHLLARWLTLITAAVASFLPPGLLLQRLTAASAWPFVGAGALSAILRYLSTLAVMRWAVPFILYIAFTMHDAYAAPLVVAALAGAIALVSGGLHGLTLGAGLFLMARRAHRPVQAASVG